MLPAVSSIGTAPGRDFVTWDAWLAAVETLGTIHIATYPNGVTGQGYPDSEFTPGPLVIRNVNTTEFNGLASSGIYAITMRAAPGTGVQRGVALAYNGNQSTYNPSNGVCLKFNLSPGSYPFDGGIVFGDTSVSSPTSSNVLIADLQLKLVNGNFLIYTDNNSTAGQITIDRCILDDFAGGTGLATGSVTIVRNTLVIIRGGQDVTFCPHGGVFDGPAGVGGHFYGCTVVSVSDNTSGTPENACTNTSGEGGGTTTWSNTAFFGFTQVSDVTGTGTPHGMTYNPQCGTDSPAITTNTHCMETSSPNVGSNVTAALAYSTSTFIGTTNAAADFRILSGSPLANLGTADATNLAVDITGSPRPLTGAIDAGCYQFTTPPLALTVNNSATPAAVISGDGIWANLTGAYTGANARVTLENNSGGSSSPGTVYHTVSMAPATSLDVVITLTQQNPITEQQEPIQTPGTYYVRYYHSTDPSTIYAQVTLNILARPQDAFPIFVGNFNNFNQAGVTVGAVSGMGTILARSTQAIGSDAQGTIAVQGHINISLTYGSLGGIGAPINIAAQFFIYGGSYPVTGHALSGQVFDSTGHPSVTFDTTTIADGTYSLNAQIIDSNDTSHNTSAYQTIPYPCNLLVMNGGALSPTIPPTGPILCPTWSQNENYHINGTTIDYITYQGGVHGAPPVSPAASYPYPGPGNSVVTVPPVWSTSSPYNPAMGGTPANCRDLSLVGEYGESIHALRMYEYRRFPRFLTSLVGGVYVQGWSAESSGDESLEGSDDAAKAQNWFDGGRNSCNNDGNINMTATPSTGPWSAYHWTGVHLSGRLYVADLTGTIVTVAGLKADTTKLSPDFTMAFGPSVNTVPVGTINTAALYTFRDFLGSWNDVCWDPRNTNICYIAAPIQHCILKVDFTTTGGFGPTNPLLSRYAGYDYGIAHDGVGGFADGPALRTDGTGAQFNGPYSICMQKVTTNSLYPQGTMFVADNYNCVIRMISADGSTVSTLVGNGSGTTGIPPASASTFPLIPTITANMIINVTSITAIGGGLSHVILALSSPVSSVGWKVTILQNGLEYGGGGSDIESSYGIYTVTTWTSPSDFVIRCNPPPTTGTITAQIYSADKYSSPTSVSFTNAYVCYPQVVRMFSTGDLWVGESWYNMMGRTVHLDGSNTITRIGPTGNLAQVQTSAPPVWGWGDVDDGVDPGVNVAHSYGACGPVDDQVIFKMDSNPGSAATAWRWSKDGTYNNSWPGQSGNDFPGEGQLGVGHYPWGFAFSKTQFRMYSAGKGQTGYTSWRVSVSGDPLITLDPIAMQGNALASPASVEWLQGSAAYLPFLLRPSWTALFGEVGWHLLGANVQPTIDDLQTLYVTDSALTTFIQGGAGGAVPRPEFSIGSDGTTPGRPLANLLYFIRRQSLKGSYPTLHPPLFQNSDNAGSGQLITRGTYSLNFIRPTITVTAGPTRINNTTIQISWTTNVATLALIAGGSPNSFVRTPSNPYSVWSPLSTSFGTTYTNVQITNAPDVTVYGTSHVAIVCIDKDGNMNRSADFAVS